jgi:hypothetical protein
LRHPNKVAVVASLAILAPTRSASAADRIPGRFTHGSASVGAVQYWLLATGAVDPNTRQFSAEHTNPDSMIQVYSLRARNGLSNGFEVAGNLAVLTPRVGAQRVTIFADYGAVDGISGDDPWTVSFEAGVSY